MLKGLLDKATVRLSGRSWWAVRYRDGRIINEWDGCDWLDLPRRGLIEGRLLCPNGQVAVLGNSEALGERLYQFKTAHVSLGLAGGAQMRGTDAHIMGIITDTAGHCLQYVWEYADGGRLVGPLTDHIDAFEYGGPATRNLCWEHLRIRPD